MASPASEEPLSLGPKEELPEEIQREFDKISEPEEDIRVSVSSDMDMDGVFEDQWLVATDKRILVFSGNHAPTAYQGDFLTDTSLHEGCVRLADRIQHKLSTWPAPVVISHQVENMDSLVGKIH